VLGGIVDSTCKGGKWVKSEMKIRAGKGQRQEGNICKTVKMKIQAEKTQAVGCCAAALGKFFPFV